jgi:hypothetical protein
VAKAIDLQLPHPGLKAGAIRVNALFTFYLSKSWLVSKGN